MNDRPTRIAIADDHPVVRRGLIAFLEAQPEFVVIGEAGDGAGLLALPELDHCDVILLDLLMPGGGAGLVEQLVERSADVRLLVLTSSEDAQLLRDVLDAGALSALLKDSSPEQLRDAIAATARGEGVLHPRIAALLDHERRDRAGRVRLSSREQDVLDRLAAGMSNIEISDQLGIGVKTVKTHVSSLLGKLDVSDRTQAAVLALRKGLTRR